MNWFSLKYFKHLPSTKLHSHRMFGHKTFFYGGGDYLHALREIFLENTYLQKFPRNAYIIDCGAHIGISVIYLKQISPTSRIIAFEPDRQNFELLKKNLESHHLLDVEAKQEAIWTENTFISFIQDGNMGSKIGVGDAQNMNQVKATRLRDYLDRPVDFLKIDIEGAEYEVLKDIKESLHFVKNLFIEYHGTFAQNDQFVEILTIIQSSGFQFYIKEAAEIYTSPFMSKARESNYDLQLNIFCFRDRHL